MRRQQRQTQVKRPPGTTRHADESSERLPMATLSPASLPALQRSIGNAAVARMVTGQQNATAEHDGSCSPEHGHDDLSVQRAPAANGETSSQQSTQPNLTFADVKGANPGLFTDFNNNYWIGNAGSEPDGYILIEQHCAYMAAYWLTHGHGAGGLRFADLDESTRRTASNTVIQWGSSGGANAQTNHAIAVTGGHSVSLANLQSDVAAGSLPPGSLIWFGNDAHAEAAVVTSSHQYLTYDPNTGLATTRTANGFRDYISTKNVFVVRPAPEADPATCKCCIIM